MANQNSERVAKNTAFMFVRMLIMASVGLFTSREVLRVLGVNDFGIYNLVGTIVVMFSFLQTALMNATSRFITYDLGKGNAEKLKRTFSMCLNMEFVLALIIIMLAEFVGPWFIGHKLKIPEGRMVAAQWVFQFSLAVFAINIIKTPINSLIVAHEHMDYYAKVSIFEALLKLGVVYLLIIFSYDKLKVYAFLQFVVALLVFSIMLIYCKKKFKECRYIKVWDKNQLKSLLGYSWWSMTENVADLGVQQANNIFFNLFGGVAANAANGVTMQVMAQVNQFISSFAVSYNPQIIKSYAAGKFEYFIKLLFSTSKLSFFLYFSVAFPILINIKWILSVWLVNPPALASSFISITILYHLIISMSEPLLFSVHATGKIKVHQILMGVTKVMSIPVAYIFLKLGYPVYMAVAVYGFFTILSCIIRLIYLKYLIHLNLLQFTEKVILQVIKIIVIAIPLPLVIKINGNNGLFVFFVSSICFYVVYLPSIYFLALNKGEKEIVQSLLGKLLTRLRLSKNK